MKRGLGWLKDRPKGAQQRADWTLNARARARLKIAETPPPSANIDELVLSVLDQGQLGSCVSNGIQQQIRMRHVAQGASDPPLGSRRMGYELSLAADGNTGIDAGTYLRTYYEILNKFGFCAEKFWPYTDGPDALRVLPNDEAFREAYDQIAPAVYRRIDTEGNERLLDIKRAIASGFPVTFGCQVSDAFCQGALDAHEPLSPPTALASVGGHCMLFLGYDGDVFRVLNSWSADFGDNGRVLFTPEYVAECNDLWVCEHAPIEGEA